MSKNIYATTLRLNLDNPADRAAWEHLQRLDRVQYRSVSRAVVAAVNAFFDRQERLIWKPARRRMLFFWKFVRPSGVACRESCT